MSKGSAVRPMDRDTFETQYDKIDWSKKPDVERDLHVGNPVKEVIYDGLLPGTHAVVLISAHEHPVSVAEAMGINKDENNGKEDKESGSENA